jgi:hypothetical protein
MPRRRTARSARSRARRPVRTARARLSSQASAGAAPKLVQRIKALEQELAQLRSVRRHFDSLLQEYHRLVSGIAALNGSKAARSFAEVPLGKPLPAPGNKRFRLTKAALMEMYATLAEKCRSVRDWTSREDICKMAGLTVAESKRAFSMCVQGLRGPDGPVKPVLQSNGKVGRVGRYRRA